MLNPPLKWVGSKRRLVNIILPLIPDHQNYYEPFLGSGAIFFAYIQTQTNKNKAYYLSDVNADLMNLWQNIQNNLTGLLTELKTFKYGNTREEYHHFRKLFNEHHIHDTYKAALFLFLSSTVMVMNLSSVTLTLVDFFSFLPILYIALSGFLAKVFASL